MTWVQERKYVTGLMQDYETNEWPFNQEILHSFKEFLGRWDDSEVAIVDTVREQVHVLEDLIPTQKSQVCSREDFSLSTYLATIPFPRTDANFKLRKLLLGAYDVTTTGTLERFSNEVNLMFPPTSYQELEETRAIFTGVELALDKGFIGKSLKRDNRFDLVDKVQSTMDQYVSSCQSV